MGQRRAFVWAARELIGQERAAIGWELILVRRGLI